MKLFPPKKIEFIAEELSNGQWKLHYTEYAPPEYLQAFKNSADIGKVMIPQADIQVNEKENTVSITLIASREEIFNFLCGEFFSLSGIAKLTLQDLFVKGNLGLVILAETEYLKRRNQHDPA